MPTALFWCPTAGDYILETKPKEISEAQRLNYEQVSSTASLQSGVIIVVLKHAFLLVCMEQRAARVLAKCGDFGMNTHTHTIDVFCQSEMF